MRCAAALLLAIALAGVATGCGDQVTEFRRQEFKPLENKADQQKAQLSAVLRTVRLGSAQDARLLEQHLAPLGATYDEMKNLDPPDEVEDTYADYLEANDQFMAAMRRFIAALKEGDKRTLRRASDQAKEAVGAALRALEPIKL